MKAKFVRFLLIGICCGFYNSGLSAQIDIQKIWCDGITVNTYIRNVSDCRQWIRCNGSGQPSSGFCPNPSFFSEERQSCTFESAANCFVCPNSTSVSYEAIDSSCNRYVRCIDGVPSELMCGAGMGFNPDTERCEGEFYRTCSLTEETKTSTIITSTRITTTLEPSTSTVISNTSTTTTSTATTPNTLSSTSSIVIPTTTTSTVKTSAATTQAPGFITSDFPDIRTTITTSHTSSTIKSSTIPYNTTEF